MDTLFHWHMSITWEGPHNDLTIKLGGFVNNMNDEIFLKTFRKQFFEKKKLEF